MLRQAAGALLASASASLLTLSAERSLLRSLPQALLAISHPAYGGPPPAAVPWQQAAIRSFSERSVAARRLEEAQPRRRKALVRRAEGGQVAEYQEEQELVSPSETSASEVQISQVINHPALIITRPIEWGTVLLGYEQANKYQVFDQDGNLVALIAEDVTGIGNTIGRQVLKTRRSFTATVFNATGEQVLFRVRRPAYLINSSMFIEDGEARVIGEVQQRWHLYKRIYDLYMERRQFARIEGGFLAWEFELKDAQGGTLALIDRNFQGFGKELFTDAGKYCIHFGFRPDDAAHIATETLRARSGRADAPEVQPLPLPAATEGKELAVIPTVAANQLVVSRPLALEERLVALAAAISIDYNYFSQHSSHGSGWLAPPLFFPGGGGGGAATEAGADAAGAAGGAGAAAEGAAGSGAGDAGAAGTGGFGGGEGSSTGGGFGGEQSLGGDAFPGSSGGGSGDAGSWQNDDEIKWDLPGSGGDGGDENDGVMGTVKKIWELFNDE